MMKRKIWQCIFKLLRFRGGNIGSNPIAYFNMYSRRDNTPPEYLNSFFLHIKLREVHEGVTSE
ncbi:protein of unknown function [Clostridium beijerinckii]|nr:protein of unknown function [Clostridium beijerinckii]